jgi:hypothetical protein
MEANYQGVQNQQRGKTMAVSNKTLADSGRDWRSATERILYLTTFTSLGGLIVVITYYRHYVYTRMFVYDGVGIKELLTGTFPYFHTNLEDFDVTPPN